MNGMKRRATVIAVALAAVIGGGAALQTLAVASTDTLGQPLSGRYASESVVAARLIDPASLVAALSGESVAAVGFASEATYASVLQEGMLSSGAASFASEVATAPLFDLAAVGAAVSGGAAATFSDTASYAGSLQAADLGGAATFQLRGTAAATALFSLDGVAAAFGDDQVEQVSFSDESSYAATLADAYLGDGAFSNQVAAGAPALDLATLAAAATGASAEQATFADQSATASYADTLPATFTGAAVGNATFSDTAAVTSSPLSLADAASAYGAAAAPTGFSDQATYAGSLQAADLGAGATFSHAAGAVSPLFSLDSLGDALAGAE